MADPVSLAQRASELAGDAGELARKLDELSRQLTLATQQGAHAGTPFVFELTIFVLAVFVGYYVVWRVTPALHSPLMAVTNAISSVIIVGALIAAGTVTSVGSIFGFSQGMGLVAVALAAVNIAGGFLVTHRMLSMFKKKTK